ncbi:tetratricopeptide repeat domain-containing protein [Purpureocillium lilacinum]|uniref:Tetratricopeptide repeat domain-containing protein n=1 Tax=Purpureocillium lilacinum TaxID=33203 RepID=A0A179FVM0_PURLI|nr:tetratricopeptide repeat domain-containing protein [Purpureocillium lilacinum]
MAESSRGHVLPRRIPPSSAAVLDDAAPVPMDDLLLGLLRAREPGTGRWLFEDETIRSWIDGTNDVRNLWLHGHDGAGKATLAATLAEEMIRRANATAGAGHERGDAVCFYICRDEGASSLNWDVMTTLVLQLALQSEAAYQELKAAVGDTEDAKALEEKLVSTTVRELADLLTGMARHFDSVSVFVVSLDGLDMTARQSVLSLLVTAGDTPGVPLRVAVTGDKFSDTDGRPPQAGRFHTIFATGRSDDIQTYVRAVLARRTAAGATFLGDEAVRDGIERYIVNMSHGAYVSPSPPLNGHQSLTSFSWLWAVCELEAQCNLARIGRWTPQSASDAPADPPPKRVYGPDPEDVRPAIFPYGPYLESVLAEGNPRTTFIVNRVLKYIFAGGLWQQARLSIGELCETLTSLLNHHPSSAWYAENNLPAHRQHPAVTEQDILRICGPFIRRTHDGTRFDIAHPSVIGFFRFHNPHLPNTRDFLHADSPAKIMGQTVDEFAKVCEILEARGLFDAAEAMHRRVVRCDESGCGPEHVSTLARVNNLASFLLDRGRLDEAEELLLRVKKGYEAMDPPPEATPDRDSMYNTYNMLGILHKRRGEPDLAEGYYLASLHGREDLYGRNSLVAARTAKNLGLLYVTMGPSRAHDACLSWERQVSDLEALLGPADEEVVAAVFDLALLYKNQDRTGEAGPLMERAVDGYATLRGRGDERTLEAMFQLGQLCAVHGDLRGGGWEDGGGEGVAGDGAAGFVWVGEGGGLTGELTSALRTRRRQHEVLSPTPFSAGYAQFVSQQTNGATSTCRYVNPAAPHMQPVSARTSPPSTVGPRGRDTTLQTDQHASPQLYVSPLLGMFLRCSRQRAYAEPRVHGRNGIRARRTGRPVWRPDINVSETPTVCLRVISPAGPATRAGTHLCFTLVLSR